MREASKQERQAALKLLLEGQRFAAQEAVVAEMTKAGYDVTQSSISRDFKELGVLKQAGAYRLPIPGTVSVSGFVLQVLESGPHMLVIKTRSGCASVVAEMLDLKGLECVAGTIAGENTVFVALTDALTPAILEQIREVVG
ncbi:MAG TPA: hypothetical protein VK171_04080 [Fimbriimonas sp.]|nr:hypothetical protein [Fimbriimonas sp.]